MGGPALPGVGWAAGIERLALLIAHPPPPRRPVALVPIGAAGEIAALKLAEDLRDHSLPVDLSYSGNLGRRLRRADRIGAFAAILLGDDELARGAATLRDLVTGTQSEVPLAELTTRLRMLAAERAAAS
jgi:histidyl-tRNA synthetase